MSINPKQKEYFDQYAESWDRVSVHDLDVVEHITSLLSLKGNENILDVGTGTGVMIPFYEKYLNTGHITALDYSEKMIAVAKRKFPEESNPLLSFRVADLYDMDEKETYDVIVCYSCFPHFPDKTEALQRLSAALKDGGTLMVSHGCSRDKINQVHRHGGEVISHDYLPCMDEMARLFTGAGISVTYTQDDDRSFSIVGKKEPIDHSV